MRCNYTAITDVSIRLHREQHNRNTRQVGARVAAAVGCAARLPCSGVYGLRVSQAWWQASLQETGSSRKAVAESNT